MGSLKETAEAYEPKTTPVISELDCVSLSVDISTKKATDSEGNDYEYYVAKVAGEEYRVPNSVVEEIQRILKENPEVQTIKVTKTGEGMRSKYTVNILE